jgi:clan AA aspartic protease
MTTGIVTSELEAVLNVHLQGANGWTDTLPAVLDTGFDGFITLPPDLLAEMGSPFAGTKRATLADGSETMFRIFDVTVHWHGQSLLVPALEVDAGALVGMALLYGSRLTMDVFENGPVRIERIR